MPVKRLHYFNHQFLDAGDFDDEQLYHLDMRRRHNRHLHTWGIADGLDVEFQSGATAVTVRSGLAVDAQGREIVLTDDATVELADAPTDADVFITIAYGEAETDPTTETGVQGNTRWTEQPRIETSQSQPSGGGTKILLAKASRQGNKVSAVDPSGRRAAGAVAGALEVRELSLSDPGVATSSWVRMRLAAAKRAALTGALEVSDALATGGNLRASGKASIGAADSPLGRLTIEDAAVPLVLRETGQGLTAGGLWRAQLDGGVLRFDVNTAAGGNFGSAFTPLALTTGGVGIGVATPQQRLSVDAGLNVDQANANAGALNPGLSFGSGSGEGIASKRTAGGNVAGLDFYTGGAVRLSIANAGGVAIGGAPSGLGRLTIEDAAVPLVLRETGVGVAAGGLWRLLLDGGILRFDVNTAGAGNFSSFQSPLALTAAGAVGVGTSTPARRFHLEGSELHVGGAGGGFSFSSRDAAWVEGPSAGERWVWFANGGIARLWSGGDRLSVQADGKLTVGGDATVRNVFLGDVGHGAAWAGFSHSGSVSTTWYALIQNTDGRWTLINKRSGGGAIELRIDNATRVGLTDDGSFYLDAANANIGNVASALRFGGYGSGEGIASKRNAGGNQFGLDFYTAGGNRMQIRNNGQVNINGQLGTFGRDPVGGLPSGWLGGVHTYDVYAEATVAAGPPGGPPRAWINSGGEVRGTSKSFVIDHPLDKDKSLVHAAIEAPELGVYYRGEGRLQGGAATIELPPYFEKLTRKQNRTVLLTPRLEDGAPVVALAASPVEDGKFTVQIAEGGNPRGRFYWEVKAVRADLPKLEVEPDRLV